MNKNEKTMEEWRKQVKKGKLIAKFMGLKIVNEKEWMKSMGSPKMYTVAKEENLKYDHSWDWLMPVSQKIDEILIDRDMRSTDMDLLSNDFDARHAAIIRLIKYYNKSHLTNVTK
jgi:hypothetical protein